jgi:hypothetical protein
MSELASESMATAACESLAEQSESLAERSEATA